MTRLRGRGAVGVRVERVHVAWSRMSPPSGRGRRGRALLMDDLAWPNGKALACVASLCGFESRRESRGEAAASMTTRAWLNGKASDPYSDLCRFESGRPSHKQARAGFVRAWPNGKALVC